MRLEAILFTVLGSIGVLWTLAALIKWNAWFWMEWHQAFWRALKVLASILLLSASFACLSYGIKLFGGAG